MSSKVGDLSSLPGSILGTDEIYIIRGGLPYKVALSAVKTFVNTDPTVIPASEPFRGALISRTSNLTGISWPLIVPWQQAVYDTDNFWASSPNPSRLIIPAGVTKVRLNASVSLELMTTAGSILLTFLKNGASTGALGGRTDRQGTTGFTSNTQNAVSPVLNCVAGDYFEVRVNVNMSGNDQILAENLTFFGIEVVEASS